MTEKTTSAVVMVTITMRESGSRTATDHEVPANSLDDLYAACQKAAGAGLVGVTLDGPEGKVTLQFRSLLRGGRKR